EKYICLTSWMIKVLSDNTAVCVEGKRKDMGHVVWHSNAVTERIASNKVRTSSGSLYVLQGKMNTAAMRKEGFPYHFIKQFTHGFSKNWKQHVEDLLEARKR
ncbi:M18BP protein, partial [Rhinopomastus cyanomelas]|nr:M18BP protein [Rhinopomastus cyanomelas]